jgi:SAM-dependent MidA family methyltransferase
VRWLERLPDAPADRIVLANEVADALPVVRFVREGTAVRPLGVKATRGRALAGHAPALEIAPGPHDAALAQEVAMLEQALGYALPDGYRSEVCLLLTPWIASLAATVRTGGLLLIDYGMARADYYRPERRDGTLICHYRQRAHDDPLFWPGLQDISAWVDFSRLAEAATAAGLSVAGYTTQAQFLLESIARDPALAERQPTPQAASALQTLILPGEMGERFKLIWLTRGQDPEGLPGRDFRNRL